MFQWLTNGKGRPAGPLGGNKASRLISVATFVPDPAAAEQSRAHTHTVDITFIAQ